MAAIGFIAFAVAAIFIGLLADAQRQHFGAFSGNLLLGAEVAVLMVVGLAASLWRKGKSSLSICLASWGAAAFFAFVAWFVHPEQMISRAEDRLGDWELAIDNYRIEQVYGEKDKDASVRFQRLATELSARRNEYEAALTRYKGDPQFFRSSFFTWSFGAIAVAFAVAGFVMFKRLCQHARQP
jgi:hypothetical protein